MESIGWLLTTIFPPVGATFAPWPNHAVFPLAGAVPEGPGALKSAPIGAAERTLDGEDQLGTFGRGRTARQFLRPKLVKLNGVIAVRYSLRRTEPLNGRI